MSDDKRQRFHEQLGQAIDAVRPVLAQLSEDELSLLSEASFKLGMLPIVIIDKDLIADQVEARWQEEKARRDEAVLGGTSRFVR